MPSRFRLVFVLVAGAVLPAHADTLIRCVGPEGRTTWSNLGCKSTERAEVQRVEPNVVDSRGLRGWAERNPAPRRPAVVLPATAPSPAQERTIDAVDCGNAKRAYEFEAGYRYRKADLLQLKRREVYDKCGFWP